MARVKFVCSRCKSDDVQRDAWARWNEAAQEWQASGIYDHGFCNACDGESHLDEVTLEAQEVKPTAPRYTLEPGRVIALDGMPHIHIARAEGVNWYNVMSPATADKLAHRIVALLNAAPEEV